MTIIVDKLKYSDFHDRELEATVIAIETYEEDDNSYSRSFIVIEMEHEDDDFSLQKVLSKIEKDETAIHSCIGNMNKIEKILDQNYLKVTAYTRRFWDDVRLFNHTASFNYAEDVHNTAAIELSLYKFIRNKYYHKDILEDLCKEGNIAEARKILEKSNFKPEELKEVFQRNPEVQRIFESHQLNELLQENLSEKAIDVRKPKI